MSMKVPPTGGPSLIDLVRSQLPLPAGAKRDGSPAQKGASLAWEKMPPAVVRVLAEVTSEGFPLGTLLPNESPGLYSSTGPALRADAPGERMAAQTRVVSRLVTAIDQGLITVDELNRFLSLVSLESGTVRMAFTQAGRDPENVVLHGLLYRLVGERFVAAGRRQTPADGDVVPRLWIQTALLLVVAGLIVVALMRFS